MCSTPAADMKRGTKGPKPGRLSPPSKRRNALPKHVKMLFHWAIHPHGKCSVLWQETQLPPEWTASMLEITQAWTESVSTGLPSTPWREQALALQPWCSGRPNKFVDIAWRTQSPAFLQWSRTSKSKPSRLGKPQVTMSLSHGGVHQMEGSVIPSERGHPSTGCRFWGTVAPIVLAAVLLCFAAVLHC
jgi:hypothetical protein